MISVKPAGFFRNERDAGLAIRFLRNGIEPPRGPQAITSWTVTELETGGWRIAIFALPSAGDTLYRGDGRGVVLDIEWRADLGVPRSLGATEPGAWVVPLDGPVSIGVRIIASTGPGPWAEILTENDVPNLLLEGGGALLLQGGGQILLEEAL